MHEAVLVEGAILPQCAIQRAAQTALDRLLVKAAAEMALIEERDYLVAFLEPGDLGSDGDDGSGAIRAGDY